MAKISTDFDTKEITLRGVAYRLKELSIGTYDKLVQLSTETKTNAFGAEAEVTDNAKLLRLMVIESSGLSADRLSGLPARVVFKLNELVNLIHFGDEPEKKDDEPAAEGDSEGNAS